jgi:multiple sugar transport system substrate-binding protein
MKELSKTKSFSRRDFLKLTGMAASAAVLAACTPQPATPTAEPTKERQAPEEATKAPDTAAEPTQAAAPQAAGATDLLYWDNNAFEFYEKPWDEKFNALIKERIPDAKLTIVHAQDGDKFLTAINAGTPPDVFFTWDQSGKVGSWITSGLLLPLDDHMASGGISKDDFPKGMLDQAAYDGKIYGIPMLADAFQLWYRPDLMKEAGISEPPKTIEDYWAFGEKLTKKDAGGKITRLGATIPSGWPMLSWCVSYGGEIWDPNTKQVTPDHPGILAAWEDLAAQWKKYDPAQLDLFNSSLGAGFSAEDPFLKDKFAIKSDAEWNADIIRSNVPNWKRGEQFEVTNHPYPASKPELANNVDLETYPVIIPYNAKQKDLGWKAMAAMNDTEFVVWWSTLLVNLPQSKKALADPRVQAIPGLDINAKILLEEKNNFRPFFTAMPIGAEYQDAFNREYDLVIHQKKSAKEALEGLKAELQPMLDDKLKS